jgi:hypothetical protein
MTREARLRRIPESNVKLGRSIPMVKQEASLGTTPSCRLADRRGSVLWNLTSPKRMRSPRMLSCAASFNRRRSPALPNFYNITIRIANVAARLAVLVLWPSDKLCPSISP